MRSGLRLTPSEDELAAVDQGVLVSWVGEGHTSPAPRPPSRQTGAFESWRERMSHGILRWEGQDLVVPLAISISHWRTHDYVGAAAMLAQPIIERYLREAARQGWHADEPSDFATLFNRSGVRTRDNCFRWRVESATIRVLRAVPIE